MLRLIVTLIWAVLVIVFSVPEHLYFKSLAKKDQVKSWQKSHSYIRWFFRSLTKLAGTDVEIRGLENVPDDCAVLYVGNHRSYFDVIIAQTLAKGPIGFVAKKELLKVPFLNLYMSDMGSLFLDRENAKEGLKTIMQGTEYMKKGLSLCLFPEGTRNKGTELLPFKEGGYRMAEKSKSPIVVMALTNFDTILEANHNKALKKTKVIIEFDKPVYPSQLSTDEKKAFYASIPGRIMEMKKTHII